MTKTYLLTDIRTDAPSPEDMVTALSALGCTVLVAPNRGSGNKYIVTGMAIESMNLSQRQFYMIEEFAPLSN